MPTALMTDMYEYTMLDALVHAEKADNPATFELFARKLPEGRRYGIVGGIGRFLDAYENFRIDSNIIDHLIDYNIIKPRTARWLRDFRFTLTIDAYPEGQTYYPYSPIMTVSGRLGECVLLETLALSILNADSAVASAAARMVVAAQGRPIIEMGSRRTHNDAAISAARTAYIQGFAATSNLEAGARYAIPTTGTAAHAFTLAFPTEREAFCAQVAAHGPGTTLLVDTYDIEEGIRTAIDVAGTGLGAIRIDSGDLGGEAFKARELLDDLGATRTGIVISSDIDEYSITALQGAPIDGFGAGTRVVTGSGHPTAGMVYKLVEIADTPTGPSRPVAKASAGKPSVGGKKIAYRDREGREFYQLGGTVPEGCTAVATTVVEAGRVVCRTDIEQSRAFAAQVLQHLPDKARPVSHGAAYTIATERKNQ